jgi:hypothetical protein
MASRKPKKDKTLSGLIGDWGGFEDLVAAIHRGSSDLSVERNVELPAKEGRTYKIDVVIRSRQGLHEIVTIVECKWWGSSVGRDRITHLKHVREQVGAQKAVCFTSIGYEAGADAVARAHDIGLFVVKPMAEADWGKPGKVIDIFMQVHQAAISPLGFPKALLLAPAGAPEATNPPRPQLTEEDELRSVNGRSKLRIRELARELRQTAFNHAVTKRRVWHDGSPGTSYVAVQFKDVEFNGGPYEIQLGRFMAHIRTFDCDVIFQVRQDRIVVDRGEKLDFALVVEDFILGERYTASKPVGVETAELFKLDQPAVAGQTPIQNGDIMCVLVDGFLDYGTLRAAKLQQDPGTVLIPA